MRDYDAALGAKLPQDATMESQGQQFLSFYQRELAQYLHARLDWPLNKYFLDKDISPVFKGAQRLLMCVLLHTNLTYFELLSIDSLAPEVSVERKGGQPVTLTCNISHYYCTLLHLHFEFAGSSCLGTFL